MCYKPDSESFSDANVQVNVSKNRYPSILPCKIYKGDIAYVYVLLFFIVNGCRPRLRIDTSVDSSDYINASFVDVSQLNIHYTFSLLYMAYV